VSEESVSLTDSKGESYCSLPLYSALLINKNSVMGCCQCPSGLWPKMVMV